MTDTTTTKTATVRRTNLGAHNSGLCGSKNSCRFHGGSVCWAIDIDGFVDTVGDCYRLGDEKGWAFGMLAFDRKWAAEAFAEWFNAEMGDWDGMGDIEGMFCFSDAGEKYRWAKCDGNVPMV